VPAGAGQPGLARSPRRSPRQSERRGRRRAACAGSVDEPVQAWGGELSGCGAGADYGTAGKARVAATGYAAFAGECATDSSVGRWMVGGAVGAAVMFAACEVRRRPGSLGELHLCQEIQALPIRRPGESRGPATLTIFKSLGDSLRSPLRTFSAGMTVRR